FGKGLVQSIFYLWGGTGLTLTTQKYFTPSGRSIQRDYSKVSFYDYYMNRQERGNGSRTHANLSGAAFHTDLGHKVYAGDGITPDTRIRAPENRESLRIYFAAFEFARQLVAGQMQGFKEYRLGEVQYKTRLSPEDVDRYPVTDKLVSAFRSYMAEQ